MMESQVSRRKVLFGLFWVYCETISAQAVTFIVTIILARLLMPNDYGTIALVTVFINIANVFVTSSFSNALIQKKDADDLDYQTMFWFNMGISIILYGILWFVAPLIAGYYNIYLLTLVLRILALKIPLSAYNSIQLAKVSHELNFRKSFVATSGSTILSAIIGIALAFLGWGLWALVAQIISNIFFNTLFLMTIVRWYPKFLFSVIRLKPLMHYGWKLLATGLMFTGYSEICKLIIGKRYSTDDLGYYEKGTSLPHFIASNIDSTIVRVLFPALSNQQDSSIRLLEIVRRATKTNSFFMTPVLFGLAITAPIVVHLLLTDKWLPCVPFIQILCFSWWLQPIQSCSVQGIKAIGRSDIYLRIEIISKLCGFVLLMMAVYIIDTVIAIAFSLTCAQIISLALYSYYAKKVIFYNYYFQICDMFLPIIPGLIMIIVVYLVGLMSLTNFVMLTIQVVIGIVSYIAVSYFIKLEVLNYLIRMVRGYL